MKKVFYFLLVLLLFSSCKKEEEINILPTTSCKYGSGNFEVKLDGKTFTMHADENTNYIVIHNYYNDSLTVFNLETKDQNNKIINLTFWIRDIFKLGQTIYTGNNLFDFNLSVDDYGYSLSADKVSFNVNEVKTSKQGIIYQYNPISATFSGIGSNSLDTFQFEGSFCINGIFQP